MKGFTEEIPTNTTCWKGDAGFQNTEESIGLWKLSCSLSLLHLLFTDTLLMSLQNVVHYKRRCSMSYLKHWGHLRSPVSFYSSITFFCLICSDERLHSPLSFKKPFATFWITRERQGKSLGLPFADTQIGTGTWASLDPFPRSFPHTPALCTCGHVVLHVNCSWAVCTQ